MPQGPGSHNPKVRPADPDSMAAQMPAVTSSVITSVTGATSAAAHAHAHGAGATTLSTPAIVLAGIAVALILISLGWAIARAFAYEPSWMPALRHSFAEAGLRVSETFAELGDWLRLGR